MSQLDQYLLEHFLDEARFSGICGLSVGEISGLIRDRLIPAPSYVVSIASVVSSDVFGDMEAPGSAAGWYFRPEHAVWVRRARLAIAEVGRERAHARLKEWFSANLQAALAELNETVWRLLDSFDEDGSIIPAGLQARGNKVWEHFLKGTYGLCVADPASEAAIARKEVLQEKLVKLSGKGTRARFQIAEAREMLALIDAYAEAVMPFSPIEYHLSSRKRLVDDLRPRIQSSTEGPKGGSS